MDDGIRFTRHKLFIEAYEKNTAAPIKATETKPGC
jgi:hypothetical protein